jgi:hypothetical protein
LSPVSRVSAPGGSSRLLEELVGQELHLGGDAPGPLVEKL